MGSGRPLPTARLGQAPHARDERDRPIQCVPSASVLLYLLIRWAVIAVALAVTTWILSGIEITGGFWGYLWVSALYGIVSAIVGTFLLLITLPLMLITFGLFAILVNAFLLQIVDWISDNFTIDEFWWTTIWAAIILAVVTVLLELILIKVIGGGKDDGATVGTTTDT